MILPSEDDSRKPGDSGEPGSPGGDLPDPAPWDDGDDPPGFFDDDDDDDKAGDPYGDSGKIQSPAPPGWREDLKEALLEAIDDLREIEDPAEDFDPPEPPDLFTFYGELAAMRNEMRRGSKRAADALQKVAEKQGEATADARQPVAMALVYMHDRLTAGEKKPLPLLESAMQQAGLLRIETKDAAFNGATMLAEGPEPRPGAKVTREIEAGFLWNGKVLRPARVAVS